jgi:8-oxo-dGTP pyrophosphatase MutT (NUDIX family)
MLQKVDDIRIRRVAGRWEHPELPPGRVEAHWRDQVAANPHLWNGRVLGTKAPGWPGGLAFANGVLSGEAVEGDFATFLAWRDWGFPEVGLRNLFGSAVILSEDGAVIYGVMHRTTANAGKIYPPGGSLEPSDCDADGWVRVVASIERELGEETGLVAADAECEGMLVVFDGPRVSVGRLFRFAAKATDLVDQIMANLDHQPERELERVVALATPGDLDAPGLMPYARRLAGHLLANLM